jgi:electron transfer flavoprotein beta subunit
MNPFDRPALEIALRFKKKTGATVTALSMGPDSCTFTLSDAMAMGADRGVLLADPALADSDTHATATALAAAIQKLSPYDLVFFGTRTADSDTGQVGPQTAVLLDIPMVTWASSVEKIETGLRVERRADGFFEQYELSLPAALTIHPGSVEPRDPMLAGIQTAYEKQSVDKWRINELGVSPDGVGGRGSPTRVTSLSRIKKERKCEFISGEAEEQAESLVKRLIDQGLIG